MYVLPPYAVTDSNLIASNIPENDYPTWSAATTYAIKARVIVLATHSVYESVQGGNLNNNPVQDSAEEEPEWWVRVGATNRWKPFDRVIQDQASATDTVTHTVTVASLLDTVAFFNLDAASVRVQLNDPNAVRRNLFVATDDFSNVEWDNFYPTSYVSDPDGGNNAQAIYLSGINDNIGQTPSPPINGPAVFSMMVRSDTQTALRFVSVAGMVPDPGTVSIGPTWTKLVFAGVCSGGSGVYFGLPLGQTGTVEFYQPQIEYGSVPSNYQSVNISGVANNLVYDRTQLAQDFSGVYSWYDYFTQPIRKIDQLLFDDLFSIGGGELTVSVESPGATAKVGEIVFGRSEWIGHIEQGAKVGIEDYSRVERDAFGNLIIVERPYADEMALTFAFPAERVAYTRRILAGRRAKGTVFHGGPNGLPFGLMTYGTYNHFNLPLTNGSFEVTESGTIYRGQCVADIEIKSLT